MRQISNEYGYSLIEIIVVIVIIGLGLSIAVYAFSLIDANNVKGYTNDYLSDVRYIKNQTMAVEEESFVIQWDYDVDEEFYYYTMYKTFLDGSPDLELKVKKIHPTIVINVDKSGVLTELKDLAMEDVRLEFEKSNGKLIESLGKTGYGIYYFDNLQSGDQAAVEIIERTGRVFLDD